MRVTGRPPACFKRVGSSDSSLRNSGQSHRTTNGSTGGRLRRIMSTVNAPSSSCLVKVMMLSGLRNRRLRQLSYVSFAGRFRLVRENFPSAIPTTNLARGWSENDPSKARATLRSTDAPLAIPLAAVVPGLMLGGACNRVRHWRQAASSLLHLGHCELRSESGGFCE